MESGCEVACFHPLHGFKSATGGFTQNRRNSRTGEALVVGCGQCIGCRLAKSNEWSVRLTHELSGHERSSFLTLTFRDESLPDDYSVNVRDLQLFMKRLRKMLGVKVRYFACGEYGEQNLRPHYHVILFGYDFPDRVLWRRSASGELCYRSEELERVWPFGHAEIGTVTKQSMAYVARYVMKKVNGERAEEHYRRVHPLTGELHQVMPEFICMSSRPGIGAEWFSKFAGDAFPSDFVVIDGQRHQVPLYYKRKLSEADQAEVSRKRKAKALLHADNQTPARLAVREAVTRLRVARLKREI